MADKLIAVIVYINYKLEVSLFDKKTDSNFNVYEFIIKL